MSKAWSALGLLGCQGKKPRTKSILFTVCSYLRWRGHDSWPLLFKRGKWLKIWLSNERIQLEKFRQSWGFSVYCYSFPRKYCIDNRPMWTYSLFKTFSHFHSPPLLLLPLHVTIRKESILSNFSNVRSTKFKEGRKEVITPFGVFHALAVISTAHFLKTHVCTIYGEKQVRLAAINPTFQFKSLWEEFQLRTGCRDFLLVWNYPLVDRVFTVY